MTTTGRFSSTTPNASAEPKTVESIYDEVGGCEVCPYVEECVRLTDSAGYTMNDEHGVCPEELVKRHQELRDGR